MVFIGSETNFSGEVGASADQSGEVSGSVAMETNQNEAVGAASHGGHDDLILGAEGKRKLSLLSCPGPNSNRSISSFDLIKLQ